MSARKKTSKMKAVEFFVSPLGNDKWSGRLARPNKRRTDGPFATVETAQKAVRRLKVGGRLAQPVRVVLRRGTYFLKKTLIFASNDSGNVETEGIPRKGIIKQDNSVTYAAYKNEKPVISGGRKITGWKKGILNGKTVWVAKIPAVKRGTWNFHQLFVNGRRRFRPRLPRKGFFRVERIPDLEKSKDHARQGQRRFCFAEGDIRAWKNITDVEVVALQKWIESRMWITSVNEKKKLVRLDRKSRRALLDDVAVDGNRAGTEYYIENVFEALNKPGQWYLDRPTGTLYYLPKKGEQINTVEVIAPRLEQVVRFEKGADKRRLVRSIRFEGITFSHNEWAYPNGWASSSQAAWEVPGAVSLRGVRKCSFERCSFAHLGTYGIELLDGCMDVEIRRSKIGDLGGGGVKIWHGCRRTTVSDNEIDDGGHIFHSAVGVLVGKSSGNRILHNHIHDFYYTGISVGWTWGYAESEAYGNIIEYNHVHDIGKMYLSDMGGIYTLGVSPGTRICFNIFHDVYCRGYGGWCVYTDEGSTDILIENNLAYRCNVSPFHQHYGKENTIRNNIFAFGEKEGLRLTRAEKHSSFTFRNNIVYGTPSTVMGKGYNYKTWSSRYAHFEKNLYFNPAKKKMDFCGMSFKTWQRLGMDKGSLIADPLFVDPEHGDFRLKRGSPALKIGFREFDLSGVGPRRIDR